MTFVAGCLRDTVDKAFGPLIVIEEGSKIFLFSHFLFFVAFFTFLHFIGNFIFVKFVTNFTNVTFCKVL